MRFIGLILLTLSLQILAQPKWERSKPAKELNVELFHATATANFPTTESLKKGDFMYEISHRFLPPVNEGYDAYWGIDGPARIRTALSYAPTDNWMLTFGRSNFLDNLDLRSKHRLLQFRGKAMPMVVSLQVGLALNTDTPEILDRGAFDGDNFQYYGQLIVNTALFNKKFGIGIVPSYLYNSDIFNDEKQYTFTLGNYYQYYLNAMWSAFVEYNPIIGGYQGPVEFASQEKSYNALSFGIDIETGGHFFRLMLSNSARLNPAQFLVGADDSASSGDWRLGFNITRHL